MSPAILGVGHTRFGELDGEDVTDFGARAAREAVLESNLDPGRIEEAYVGNVGSAAQIQTGSVGQAILRGVGIGSIPVTRVENACSSSSCALREAVRAVRSGDVAVALAMGVEKMTGVPTDVAMGDMAGTSYAAVEGAMGMTFMGMYGCVANAYRDHYGTEVEPALTRVAVKNHANGAANPLAHFQRSVSAGSVRASPVVADPLRLYHCSPMSDGGTAVVVAADDVAEGCHETPVSVETVRMGTWSPGSPLYRDALTESVAGDAYEQTGLGPDDLDVVELHDAAAMGELLRCEALGLCDDGGAASFVLEGHTARDGRMPVNTSGGLKARGHPIGATGLAQICELVWQLRVEAGPRQVDGAEVGLAQNAGGSLFGKTATSTVTILAAS